MKHILLILVLLLSTNCKSQENESLQEINVLFIGNSLTYYHQMPEMVQKMVNETNPNIKIEQSTFPGMSLTGHLDNIVELRTENSVETRKKQSGELTETEQKINEKKWDYVILQEGTVRLLIPEVRKYKVDTAISEIKKRVSNPDCKFILFETWPSKKEYPKQYCYSKWMINHSLNEDQYCSPEIASLDHEIKLINDAYKEMADKNGLIKSDNGTKYYRMLTEYPNLEIYDDNIHPNENGSFLNACIFYQLLTGRKASELSYNGNIERKTATLLKKIVE